MKILCTLVLITSALVPCLAEEQSADQLVANVVEARKTTGFRIRAKLILTTPGSSARDTKQLLIKGRRAGEATKVLYQVLWPAESKGAALLIDKSADRKLNGFLFTPPDKVIPLTPELMQQPFLGSDLSIEDLAEDFWHWPSQKIVGEEIVQMKPCKIVESRPAVDTQTQYLFVKTWISPEISLPMRIHKFAKDGSLVKRINVDKVLKEEGKKWVPATIVVEAADGHHRTMLDGSKGESGLDIPDEDFTLKQIKSLATSH